MTAHKIINGKAVAAERQSEHYQRQFGQQSDIA